MDVDSDDAKHALDTMRFDNCNGKMVCEIISAGPAGFLK
jgi:hypothetical protein